jgi:polar amino acid transport system substrate-binding protein
MPLSRPIQCCLTVILCFIASLACANTTIHYLINGKASEPYQIPGKGLGQGIVTDIVREIFNDSSYNVQAIVQPPKRMRSDLVSGRFINWIGYGSNSWTVAEVKKKAIFSRTPLFPYYYSLVSVKNKQLPQVTNLSKLRGHSLITIFGYSYPKLAGYKQEFGFSSMPAKSHKNAIRMLLNGRGDYYMAHRPRAAWAIKQLGLNKSLFSFHDIPDYGAESSIRLIMDARMDPSTVEFIEQRLEKLNRSGKLAEIIEAY